ncbi:30S ribosomal protein S27ae [Candidatus Woesearchaeota archaeon]|nr:30S ribosomal protein S27ae [Candidatus Woesearchaeota archaeon]
MAEQKEKKAAPKAEKQKKGKRGSKRWELYDLSGGLKRKNKFCPKCSSGIFMAKHKDRIVCGTCHYTEFIREEKTK